MPRKPPTLEQAIARMRASGAYHRGRVRPPKPMLVLPEGCRDVTAEQAGVTVAIVGYPGRPGINSARRHRTGIILCPGLCGPKARARGRAAR